MEETGCEIICGAPKTLVVMGYMMIMMMMMMIAKFLLTGNDIRLERGLARVLKILSRTARDVTLKAAVSA